MSRPTGPVGYWPEPSGETDEDGFRQPVEGFLADGRALEELALDPGTDLHAVLQGTPGHTVLRELILVGNHNSYRVGEFAILRQVMGSWPAGRG